MLYDPDRRWIDRGACVGKSPGLFFAPNGSQLGRKPAASTQATWDEAKKICKGCPVMYQCRRDTLGEEFGVWGGLDEHQRYQIRQALSKRKRYKTWPLQRRLAWGKHLAYLRANSMTWKDIGLRTGLTVSVGLALIQEWREHQAENTQPVAKVVNLPLPELIAPRQWPAVPGKRHAWVRNGAVFADGWYAGETEDGKWLLMQVHSGRGNVKKFFSRSDVRFYTRQDPWIVPYAGREAREKPAA